nr:MAG TPA: baseplate protein [Caudoviricetes sp.]
MTADRRYRLQVQEGEVAIFDDQGQRVYLKRDGINVVTPKNLTATVGGSMSADVTGNVSLKAPQTMIESNVSIMGTLKVSGQISGTGGMTVSGGTGASVTGSLAVTGGDVTADGISLKGHTHDCPQGGSTGPAK